MDCLGQFSDLLACDSENDWHERFVGHGDALGFEQTLVAIFPSRDSPKEAEFAFLHSNYSANWRDKYDAQNLGYVDPTVSHCATKSTPLIWSPELFSSPRQREMYEEACVHKLRSGVTLPIHGPGGELGILCFVSDTKSGGEFMRHAEHVLPELSIFRDFILESSSRFRQSTAQGTDYPPLTPCELECLKWCADGKSSWETATILHCSEATVNFHIGNVRRKLNVTTRRQAVVKAMRLGIVSPA